VPLAPLTSPEDERDYPVDEINAFTVTTFTTGGCCEFATELQKRIGGRIDAEIDPTERDACARIVHAWVVRADGRAVDVRGVHATDYAPSWASRAGLARETLPDIPGIPNAELIAWARELIANNPDHFQTNLTEFYL
jgi:hypothetical protein